MAGNNSKHICVLGCAGFIGSHFLKRVLTTTDWTITGIDIQPSKIQDLTSYPNFEFVEFDIHDTDRLRKYIAESDIVMSLAAICNPSQYNKIPIDVIDINFTKPAEIVKICAEEKKWLIHFSTSEVYGRTIGSYLDLPFDTQVTKEHYILNEDNTPLVMGPIKSQRWSYATAKQLLERVIFAYNYEMGLEFTVIRPFNFIGPKMDFIPGVDGQGLPRVLACFMEALLYNKPLQLVDGGHNLRTFTYIDDAIDATMAILNRQSQAKNQIFNIANEENEISIKDLAELMSEIYSKISYSDSAIEIKNVSAQAFYGEGYEDCDRRVPDMHKARTLLDWNAKVPLKDALQHTIQYYIDEYQGKPQIF